MPSDNKRLSSIIDGLFNNPIGSIVKLTVNVTCYRWVLFCKVSKNTLYDCMVILLNQREYERSIKLFTLSRWDNYFHPKSYFSVQLSRFLSLYDDNELIKEHSYTIEVAPMFDRVKFQASGITLNSDIMTAINQKLSQKYYFPVCDWLANDGDLVDYDPFLWFHYTNHIIEIDIYNYTKINIYKLSQKDHRNYSKYFYNFREEQRRTKNYERSYTDKNYPWVDTFIAEIKRKKIYRTIEIDHENDNIFIKLPYFTF